MYSASHRDIQFLFGEGNARKQPCSVVIVSVALGQCEQRIAGPDFRPFSQPWPSSTGFWLHPQFMNKLMEVQKI
jgi:hypothetical protein